MATDVTPPDALPDLRQQAYNALHDLPADYEFARMEFTGRDPLLVLVWHVKRDLDIGRVTPETVLTQLRRKNMLRPTGDVR